MALPTVITDLSASAASNSPQGSDPIGTSLDDFIRINESFIRQLWDMGIVYCGTASGTDTIVLTPSIPITAFKAGQGVAFITAGANSSTTVTINPSALGAKNLTKNGAAALAAGDLQSGALVIALYDGTQFQLQGVSSASVLFGTEQTLSSATTTDLGSIAVKTNIVDITGTTTITSLGTSASTASPLYFVRFTGALVLTYNATSLILPGAANITTAAGDAAIFKYEGSGNWRCIQYTPAAVTGSGATVQANSPQLITPKLGAATADSLIVKAGSGTATGKTILNLYNSGPQVGNNGGSEYTMYSYSMPASTLVNNGDCIEIIAAGVLTSNTNTKTFKIYFGSTVVFSRAMTVSSSNYFCVKIRVEKRSSNSQEYVVENAQDGSTIVTLSGANCTETDTAAIVIKSTVTSTGTSDIVQKYLLVNFIPTS